MEKVRFFLFSMLLISCNTLNKESLNRRMFPKINPPSDQVRDNLPDIANKITAMLLLDLPEQEIDGLIDRLDKEFRMLEVAIKKKYLSIPVYASAVFEKKRIMERLKKLGEGIDIFGEEQYLVTPQKVYMLSEGLSRGKRHFLDCMIKTGKYLNAISETGDFSIHIAVKENYINLVELFLNIDSSLVNRPNRYGILPIHIAVAKRYKNMLTLLVKQGAALDVPENTGLLPIHMAVKGGTLEILDILLQRNATLVNVPNAMGDLPIYMAIRQNNEKIVDFLIKKGASLTVSNHGGNFLLHMAAKRGYYNIVSLLIRAGAPVNTMDENKSSPLHLAAIGKAMMERKGIDVKEENYSKVIALLLQKDPSLVNLTIGSGISPLYCAVWAGYLKLVLQLVKAGALLEQKDAQGRTPLNKALEYHRNPYVLKYFLDQGFDVIHYPLLDREIKNIILFCKERDQAEKQDVWIHMIKYQNKKIGTNMLDIINKYPELVEIFNDRIKEYNPVLPDYTFKALQDLKVLPSDVISHVLMPYMYVFLPYKSEVRGPSYIPYLYWKSSEPVSKSRRGFSVGSFLRSICSF